MKKSNLCVAHQKFGTPITHVGNKWRVELLLFIIRDVSVYQSQLLNYLRRQIISEENICIADFLHIEAIFDQREWKNLLGHHHGISASSSLHVREAIVLKRVHIYCYLLRERKNKVLWNLTLSAFLTVKSRRVMIGPIPYTFLLLQSWNTLSRVSQVFRWLCICVFVCLCFLRRMTRRRRRGMVGGDGRDSGRVALLLLLLLLLLGQGGLDWFNVYF